MSKAEEKRANDALTSVRGRPITNTVPDDHHQVSTATNINCTCLYRCVFCCLATD
jgi:hypothetical protein